MTLSSPQERLEPIAPRCGCVVQPFIRQYGALSPLASVSGSAVCGRRLYGCWLTIKATDIRTDRFFRRLPHDLGRYCAGCGYRRTIIHLDQHAVLKVLRDLPHTQQHLQNLSIRGSEAWAVDAADVHPHVDFLFSRYEKMAAQKPLSRTQRGRLSVIDYHSVVSIT